SGWNRTDPSLETAMETDAYYQFGLEVAEGYIASLSSLDLSLRRSGVNAPMNMALYASLDGFVSSAIEIQQFNYYGRVSGTPPPNDPLLDDPFYYMEADLPGRPNDSNSPGDPIPTVTLT